MEWHIAFLTTTKSFTVRVKKQNSKDWQGSEKERNTIENTAGGRARAEHGKRIVRQRSKSWKPRNHQKV